MQKWYGKFISYVTAKSVLNTDNRKILIFSVKFKLHYPIHHIFHKKSFHINKIIGDVPVTCEIRITSNEMYLFLSTIYLFYTNGKIQTMILILIFCDPMCFVNI